MPAISPYLRAAVIWLLILGAAELVMRALDVRMSGSSYTADTLTGVGLRPGAKSWSTNEGVAWSEINSHGYRDLERSVAKSDGTFRVAVLGDSITEARQVAQDVIFTRLMERDLGACSSLAGTTVEVLNFAVPGFGTSHELLTLRERVWPYEPDLAMLVFYSGNDVFDNHRKLRGVDVDVSPYFLLKDGKLVLDESFRQGRRYRPRFKFAKDAASDALNSSVLALTIYETRLRLETLRVRRALAAEPPPSEAPKPGELPGDYFRYLFFAPPANPIFADAWNVTEALLGAIAADARQHETPFLLIGMPAAEQYHPDESVRERIRSERGLETLDYPESRLAAWAAREETPFFDAGPPLREYAVREQAYLTGFPNTTLGAGHLNELGHQVASRLFSEAVCDALPAANAP